MSHSDFGFLVRINEYNCFPNLFFLLVYTSTTLTFELELFFFQTSQNFVRNLSVPTLECYHYAFEESEIKKILNFQELGKKL